MGLLDDLKAFLANHPETPAETPAVTPVVPVAPVAPVVPVAAPVVPEVPAVPVAAEVPAVAPVEVPVVKPGIPPTGQTPVPDPAALSQSLIGQMDRGQASYADINKAWADPDFQKEMVKAFQD